MTARSYPPNDWGPDIALSVIETVNALSPCIARSKWCFLDSNALVSISTLVGSVISTETILPDLLNGDSDANDAAAPYCLMWLVATIALSPATFTLNAPSIDGAFQYVQ